MSKKKAEKHGKAFSLKRIVWVSYSWNFSSLYVELSKPLDLYKKDVKRYTVYFVRYTFFLLTKIRC